MTTMRIIVGIRDALVFKYLKPFGVLLERLGTINAVSMEVPDGTDFKLIRKVDGVTSVRKDTR
jgi:hypothetical protein